MQTKAMKDVRGNTPDFAFTCSICMNDGHIRGQHDSGHSLVEASCPETHVFHLKCITQWLDGEQQAVKALDERQCSHCLTPGLPLIRMDGPSVLDDESPYCESMMLIACRSGNLKTLKMLLREKAELVNWSFRSALTGHREYPLAVAIKCGHTQFAQALIDAGADVDAADHDGETPLHIAARKSCTGDFEMLIRAGANSNNVLRTAVREGNTELLEYLVNTHLSGLELNDALCQAAEQGQVQCLERLIKAGANDLNCALYAAAKLSQTQSFQFLIKAGANDLNGALYAAALQENLKSRDDLIQLGADLSKVLLTAAREGSRQYLSYLIDSTNINTTDSDGQTLLHITAANGHSNCLEVLLETRGVNVNATDMNGETALHLAVYNGHVECLKQLMEKGVSVNATNNKGETALHIATKISLREGRQQWAAMGKDFSEILTSGRKAEHYTIKKDNDAGCLKELIDNRGVNINVADNDGITPLMIAALWGKRTSLEWLLEAHADTNTTAKCSSTALIIAASWGRTECLKVLLAKKADINACMITIGATSLHLATTNGHTESVKVLMAAEGVKVNKKRADGWTALRLAACLGYSEIIEALLTAEGILVNDKTERYGLTALHLAVQFGRTAAVRALLAAKDIEVNGKSNNYDAMALHLATQLEDKEMAIDTLMTAESVKVDEEGMADGWAALHLAVYNGYTRIVTVLLAAEGINVNEKRADGWTPLHLAARYGRTEIVKKLLAARGIKVNEKTGDDGSTALHLATRYGHTDIVRVLLAAKGINVNEKTGSDGSTALHLAVRNDCKEIVKVLLGAEGINVNEKKAGGWTPLHLAARYGCLKAIEVLLAAEDIKINEERNDDGYRAIDLAINNRHSKCRNLLLENGADYESGCLIM